MIDHARVNRFLWAGSAGLALVASITGLVLPGLYDGVIHAAQRPGLLSQDILTIPIATVLLLMALGRAEFQPKRHLASLGLAAYLSYAYGILAIERVYNPLYLVYLAAFALSTWSVVVGVASLRSSVAGLASLPRWLRRLSAVGALLQPVVFVPLWVASLVPLMISRRQIDALYSIYLIDLCFVMPAFAVVAVLTLRNSGRGLLFAPAMFVFGAALIASLALGELVTPLYGRPFAVGAFVAAGALTLLFAALAALHLSRLDLHVPGSRDDLHRPQEHALP